MESTSILAAAEAIKLAIAAARTITSSTAALEQADLKLRLSEVVSSLADAREALNEAGEELARRDAENARLQDALRLRGKVERNGDAYFMLGDEGKAFGDAFCSYCWESDQRLFHLTSSPAFPRERIWAHCKHTVRWDRITWPEDSGG